MVRPLEGLATARPGVLPWQVADNATAQAACEAAGGSYWSPDGSELIFQSTRPPYACDQIYVIPATGGEAELDLDASFPTAVQREVAGLQEDAENEMRHRLDLRTATTVVTIDPLTSRDFDDAISVEGREGGCELGVHIADVSHYVRPGTAVDDEARRRRTQKSVLERKAPPTFDVIVEIQDRDRVAVHADVAETVDAMLRGDALAPEMRWKDDGGVHRTQARPRPGPRSRIPGERFGGPPGSPSDLAQRGDLGLRGEGRGPGHRFHPFGKGQQFRLVTP